MSFFSAPVVSVVVCLQLSREHVPTPIRRPSHLAALSCRGLLLSLRSSESQANQRGLADPASSREHSLVDPTCRVPVGTSLSLQSSPVLGTHVLCIPLEQPLSVRPRSCPRINGFASRDIHSSSLSSHGVRRRLVRRRFRPREPSALCWKALVGVEHLRRHMWKAPRACSPEPFGTPRE